MRSDLEIQADVMKELKWDPSITSDHIGVSVSNGIVTLTGYVPSYVEKWGAEKAVERVAGVRAIADELEVKLPDEARREDVEIAKAATDALKWNVSVPENIKVVVDNGWVTLKGEVEWEFQREAAEKAVRSLRGVVGVINDITIKAKAQPSDIKKEIEEALKRTAEEEAKNIEVQVEGEKVILKGKVRSLKEYWAVEGAAWSAPGVRKVESQLEVAA